MIHPFNCRELLYTTDMNTYAFVRDVLEANGIDYVRNPLFATWYRMTNSRAGLMQEYYVYVKKTDYEKALHLLHQARKAK